MCILPTFRGVVQMCANPSEKKQIQYYSSIPGNNRLEFCKLVQPHNIYNLTLPRLVTCLGIACFYFKKRLISTEIAFSLYSFNILSVLITVLGFEYYLSYRQKQKQSKENGKFSNRRMSPVPLANCLTVGILGMVTLTVSTLICILVWAK